MRRESHSTKIIPGRAALQQDRCRCICSATCSRAPEPHLRCSFPTRRPSGKVGGKEGGVERVTLQSTSHSERWIPNSHGDLHPPSLAYRAVIYSALAASLFLDLCLIQSVHQVLSGPAHDRPTRKGTLLARYFTSSRLVCGAAVRHHPLTSRYLRIYTALSLQYLTHMSTTTTFIP